MAKTRMATPFATKNGHNQKDHSQLVKTATLAELGQPVEMATLQQNGHSPNWNTTCCRQI